MSSAFIEFAVCSAERFEALSKVFAALKHDKDTGVFRSIEAWKSMFDARALGHFWWPSQAELEDWKRRWFATPYPQRFSDPELKRPWDFASMFEAFQNGEYQLVGLIKIGNELARLEFEPLAQPFGGTGCLRALIEAFEHRITDDSNET